MQLSSTLPVTSRLPSVGFLLVVLADDLGLVGLLDLQQKLLLQVVLQCCIMQQALAKLTFLLNVIIVIPWPYLLPALHAFKHINYFLNLTCYKATIHFGLGEPRLTSQKHGAHGKFDDILMSKPYSTLTRLIFKISRLMRAQPLALSLWENSFDSRVIQICALEVLILMCHGLKVSWKFSKNLL